VLAETDPTIETRVIAPAGHWVNYEAAAEVNALLIEWLTRRRA
jgi:pimeloyl-ACP methyl ester carboxylesterase